MALSLKEKAERQIASLEKQGEKLTPRYEKAKARIEKKRATFAKQKDSMEKAEKKFAVLEAKRNEAQVYIDALRNAIGEDSVTEADVQAAEDAQAAVAAVDVEDEPEADEDDAPEANEDDEIL